MNTIAKRPVSVIIPTLNESGTITQLVKRIHFALSAKDIDYEIICIDDHSTDGTQRLVEQLHDENSNVRLIEKVGERGKASSLLQGFSEAKHPLICMIDGDLQYPPEAIASMYDQMHEKGADIVVTERIEAKTSVLRKLQSTIFSGIFTRGLFGIPYDSQSGLKLFHKDVIDSMDLKPSPWSFDLEFLVRSLEREYRIISHKILFKDRTAGESKVSTIKTSIELAKSSVMLRLNSSFIDVRKGLLRNKRAEKIVEAAKLTRKKHLAAKLVAVVTLSLLASQLTPPSVHALSLGGTINGLTETVNGLLNPQTSGNQKSPSNENTRSVLPIQLPPILPVTPQPAPATPSPTKLTAPMQSAPKSSSPTAANQESQSEMNAGLSMTPSQSTAIQPSSSSQAAKIASIQALPHYAAINPYAMLARENQRTVPTDYIIVAGVTLLVGIGALTLVSVVPRLRGQPILARINQ